MANGSGQRGWQLAVVRAATCNLSTLQPLRRSGIVALIRRARHVNAKRLVMAMPEAAAVWSRLCTARCAGTSQVP